VKPFHEEVTLLETLEEVSWKLIKRSLLELSYTFKLPCSGVL
jgi:hypothetical protein